MSISSLLNDSANTHRVTSSNARSIHASSKGGTYLYLEKVGKKFADLEVLKGIDLEVEAGQFIAIVGRSGCGKSTLLRLLAGLDSQYTGSVSADNHAKLTATDIRMMFQDDRLLPWKSVIDNIGLGLKGEWKTRAIRVLDEVGLSNKADAWPATLSGGQRQRVALARALIHQPKLLLLDEPLGALDALTRIEMQRLIERLWQQHGFTVLLVTHDVQEAVQLADRVIVLEQGRIGMDLTVDLPRSRDAATPDVARLEGKVLKRVLDQGMP